MLSPQQPQGAVTGDMTIQRDLARHTRSGRGECLTEESLRGGDPVVVAASTFELQFRQELCPHAQESYHLLSTYQAASLQPTHLGVSLRVPATRLNITAASSTAYASFRVQPREPFIV